MTRSASLEPATGRTADGTNDRIGGRTTISLGKMGSRAPLAAVVAAALLAACSGSSTDNNDSVVVQGDVPVVYAKRSTTIRVNPTDGTPSANGGDLMLREKSSPSAREHNLTAQFTQGNGDASDPEVSYDGKKVVFAMRCPTSNTTTVADANGTQVAACTGRWNIWEYDMTGTSLAGGKFRRLTASTADDDVDPAYLPAGQGFVWAAPTRRSTSTSARRC
jgi:hypothetical protein